MQEYTQRRDRSGDHPPGNSFWPGDQCAGAEGQEPGIPGDGGGAVGDRDGELFHELRGAAEGAERVRAVQQPHLSQD